MSDDHEATSLQDRMQKIRDKRAERVGDLRLEAQRLVDWREYVRSAPMASMLGSVAAGFLAVNALRSPLPSPQPTIANHSQPQPSIVAGTHFQWAMSMLLPIVTNTAKNYLMQSLSTAMQGSSNENQSTPKTVPQRPTYSK